jgi:beta-glucanase (GH16 family)
MAAMLPIITKHKRFTPWITAQIYSYRAVRIKPPFYVEARAKMPAGNGAPFPAIWLVTGAHRPPPLNYGKEYEIDLHEGFGDSNRLHSTIHWNLFTNKPDFPSRSVVDMATIDLSADFNTWGCKVSDEQQVFYFNGEEVGRVKTPKTANQDFGIMMSVPDCRGLAAVCRAADRTT